MPDRSIKFLVLFFSLLTSSCVDTPEVASDAEPISIAPSDILLKEIMQGLEADLAIVAHGIWVQDRV